MQLYPVRNSSRPSLLAGVKTTLFSFGYWGSGNSTRALVEAINEAEALRSFEPPLWVDVRISRSVRAVGFRDHAFEELLGKQYIWLPDLGNLRALEAGDGAIEIKNPDAADDLLDCALVSSKRRVIFFCSCEVPGGCHRHVVGKLVKEAARGRGGTVEVVEWPGGEPKEIEFEVPSADLRAVAHGSKKRLPVPPGMLLGTAVSLPWATRATLKAGDESLAVLVGPARFNERGPHLVVLQGDVDAAEAYRQSGGYAPL